MDFDLLRELATLTSLAYHADAAPGGPRERELLVRQAAATDRTAESDTAAAVAVAGFIHTATDYALMLLTYDRQHGTTRGPIAASDPAWDDDPRGYARQEHRAWVLG